MFCLELKLQNLEKKIKKNNPIAHKIWLKSQKPLKSQNF